MSDLTEFLLARIAEDEAVARVPTLNGAPIGAALVWDVGRMSHDAACITVSAARVLAECKAKRRIVEELHTCERLYDELHDEGDDQRWEYLFRSEAMTFAAKHLAQPYAAHPDFREEWRA